MEEISSQHISVQWTANSAQTSKMDHQGSRPEPLKRAKTDKITQIQEDDPEFFLEPVLEKIMKNQDHPKI